MAKCNSPKVVSRRALKSSDHAPSSIPGREPSPECEWGGARRAVALRVAFGHFAAIS